MTYLIALIIAIVLGAVIALLSFVNIGSGFSGQSAAAKAQQFSQAGSQLEVAMSAYRAATAGSAFTAGTTIGDGLALTNTSTQLGEWIKEKPVAPIAGTFDLVQGTTNTSAVYLVLSGEDLTPAICDEIVKLSGTTVPSGLAGAASLQAAADTLSLGRLTCGENTALGENVAIFRVE